jgi:pantothenate synthetase
MKLFNIIQPNHAYFGEKDAQPLAVVRKMAADLNVPVVIVPVPIVREPDAEVRLEYLEIADPEEMRPVDRILGPVRVAGAIWLGSTRLIDNVLCSGGRDTI